LRALVFCLCVSSFALACGDGMEGSDGGADASARVDSGGGRDDGGPRPVDAGCGECPPEDCCVAGECVPADVDGDGYRMAECLEAGPADCDDEDAELSPFPPRELAFVPHGELRFLSDLSAIAISDDCALAGYSVEDPGGRIIEIDRLDGSAADCGGDEIPRIVDPATIACGAGNFETVRTLDLALHDGEIVLAVGGDCSVAPAARVAVGPLDGGPGDRFDEIVLDGVLDVAILPGGSATSPLVLAIREGDSAVALVRAGGTQMLRMTSTGDWLAAAGDVALFADNAVLSMTNGTMSTLREEPGNSSRAAIAYFGEGRYGVFAHRNAGELAMVGPLAGPNGLDVVGPPAAPWLADVSDVMLEAVALDATRFVVASNTGGSGVRVALGSAGDALSLEAEFLIASPDAGNPLTDLAIAARESEGRADVWIATSSDRLYSAHFAICD
jgi:hypothetical protein